jgi:alkylation response protein AidB-like acyl-CoA dehydrogenase
MVTSTALSAAKISGGSFLIEDRTPDEVFTPEDFTEQHLLIAQTAEEFAIKEIVPNAEKMEHKDFSVNRELVRKAGELGLSGVDIPEQYGGMQLDKVTSAIVADRLAKYAGFSTTWGAHACIGTLPIVYFGTEEQKKNISPAWLTARRSVPTHFQNHLRDLTPSIAAPGPHSPPTANTIS